ncbi:MAG: hypothetical protein QOE97_1373 [Pseudonocardiales bacterium]|nr:hypothetical protein [Pseudonocardiales bacterium]
MATLRDGTTLVVHNIAWGYDDGDDSAHVTTNISPRLDGTTIDFFCTSDVVSLADPQTGAALHST